MGRYIHSQLICTMLDLRKKYQAKFDLLNTIVQVLNIAHTRSISLTIKGIDNDFAQYN